VIDVDQVSRELQEPGEPLYERIVARWGADVVAADGRLDRAALSAIVFGDRAQLSSCSSTPTVCRVGRRGPPR
jgi:dephospho-CoA kinase